MEAFGTVGMTFGIVGMSFGTLGFIFSINAVSQIANLEKQLKDAGVLDNKET